MTLAYRTGNTNKLIDSNDLLKDQSLQSKPKYRFLPFQEYKDAITFLFDPYYQLNPEVKKELARIALIALDQMPEYERQTLPKIGIRDKGPFTLDELLPRILQIALKNIE